MIGAERIEPGRAPGGLVVHTYSPSGRLLVEHCLGPGPGGGPSLEQMELDALGVRDAIAAEGGYHLAVFDGDTGDRWEGAELEAFAAHFAMLHPCPVFSSVSGLACTLPAGHPPYSEWRFHRYPEPAARGDA